MGRSTRGVRVDSVGRLSRDNLRARIRAERTALGRRERISADRALTRRVQRSAVFRRAKRVAIYLAFDGEANVARLIGAAPEKKFFAPVLLPRGLAFARIHRRSRLIVNRLGIAEPGSMTLEDPRNLDLVLTPLVAFDDEGMRVGLGGGHYDRCFAFLRNRASWFRPKLVGVGYEFQRVPKIESHPWDVRLWGAVTEAATYRFSKRGPA